jgi:hypothetical protein
VAAPEVRSICGDVGKVYLLKVTLSLTVLSWFSYGLIAQTSALSLSSAVVNPGGTATLGLALTVSGTAPSGLQWTITYSPQAHEIKLVTVEFKVYGRLGNLLGRVQIGDGVGKLRLQRTHTLVSRVSFVRSIGGLGHRFPSMVPG